jgi:hypothetical protein
MTGDNLSQGERAVGTHNGDKRREKPCKMSSITRSSLEEASPATMSTEDVKRIGAVEVPSAANSGAPPSSHGVES